MTDVLIKALYNRIKAGQMTPEQVPEVYREEILNMLSEDYRNEGNDN